MSERFYGQYLGRKSDGEAEGSDVGGTGVQCLGRKSDGEVEESDVGGVGVQCFGRESDGEAWMQRLPMR